MNKCEHEFFEVSRGFDAKMNPASVTIVVCAYCGQTRSVSSEGFVEVIKVTGVVKWPQPNPPQIS